MWITLGRSLVRLLFFCLSVAFLKYTHGFLYFASGHRDTENRSTMLVAWIGNTPPVFLFHLWACPLTLEGIFTAVVERLPPTCESVCCTCVWTCLLHSEALTLYNSLLSPEVTGPSSLSAHCASCPAHKDLGTRGCPSWGESEVLMWAVGEQVTLRTGQRVLMGASWS